jgi:hypothetical protein
MSSCGSRNVFFTRRHAPTACPLSDSLLPYEYPSHPFCESVVCTGIFVLCFNLKVRLGQVNGKVGSLSAVCENGVQKETIVGIRAILWVERDRGEQSPVVPGHLGRSDNFPELPQKGHRRQSPLVRPCEGLKCGV